MKKAKIKIVPIPLTTPSRAARRTPRPPSHARLVVGFEPTGLKRYRRYYTYRVTLGTLASASEPDQAN